MSRQEKIKLTDNLLLATLGQFEHPEEVILAIPEDVEDCHTLAVQPVHYHAYDVHDALYDTLGLNSMLSPSEQELARQLDKKIKHNEHIQRILEKRQALARRLNSPVH